MQDKKRYYLGIDIGGSHYAMGIVDTLEMRLLTETVERFPVDSGLPALAILDPLVSSIRGTIEGFRAPVMGIGISVPGPFDYDHGVSHIRGLNKYDSLFGVNLKLFLWAHLQDILESSEQITCLNDADSFVLGETYANKLGDGKVMGVTLGTGIGSGFVVDGKVATEGDGVPEGGNIYHLPFKGKSVEDWISTRWFLDTFSKTFGRSADNVRQIAEQADTSRQAREIFERYGRHLGEVMQELSRAFRPDVLVIGGSISKSYHLFGKAFEACFTVPQNIRITKGTAHAAILGAVIHLTIKQSKLSAKRKTEQYVMPMRADESRKDEGYTVYPSFEITTGTVSMGVDTLADELPKKGCVLIDGYMGAYWEEFMAQLSAELQQRNVEHINYDIASAYKDVAAIEKMVAPFLGGGDPVFGKIYPGDLEDFFDSDKLKSIRPTEGVLNIVYGPGATLSGQRGTVVYVDIPKNEIQFRSRAGQVANLGNIMVPDQKQQYKRMYFIDWPVLNRHKQRLLKDIDLVVDGQFGDSVTWCTGETLRNGLQELSSHAFRPRPWFSPGVWGGDWMKKRFGELAQNVPNYAWSFELIAPENGIVLSKNGIRLEVSFDFLMFHDHQAILGKAAEVFGTEFPIRFDYLDTVNGQNLSLQCHPTLAYMRENFGENFTQDETYYILDAVPGAQVYLGFREGVRKEEFRQALEESHDRAEPMPVEDYVQTFDAKKHDLFLIPNGTVHCSGIGNLVLEISSTPYIFTFKMYDWMRLDLDGRPRPLNIERGVANLNMDCQGDRVEAEYISRPEVVLSGDGWKKVKLPTHPKHFYEIHRFEFIGGMTVETDGQCHILNLVEGTKIRVTANGRSMDVHYAETFVVPAATGSYKIENLGEGTAMVVQSNVKQEISKTGI
ncbi:MAG: transcriptional regulator [Muricauda sp.]|nr:ROK family protein [Allomuricauda sp.]MAU17107.1 transcriptional regulator [Allomuricauda sp.]|tara:strand:- start:4120 stop:6807 length:2688 start_codon:yes stop_codon:yes gene_type:complete